MRSSSQSRITVVCNGELNEKDLEKFMDAADLLLLHLIKRVIYRKGGHNNGEQQPIPRAADTSEEDQQ